MTNSTAYDDMQNEDIQTIENILTKMLNSDDIELKTEIADPHALAALWSFANRIRDAGLPKAAQIIYDWIDKDLLYMVSYDRKRSEEIIRAVSEAIKARRTVTNQLLGQTSEGN